MQSPPKATLSHAHQGTAAHCAVDPIEAPAPAWILDSAALESPASLRPAAYLAPSHVAAASFGVDAVHAHPGPPASMLNSCELQKAVSAQADADHLTRAAEPGSPAGMPAVAATRLPPGSEHAEAAAGRPEEEHAGAAWPGFAAHAGISSAASVQPHVQHQVVDNRPEPCGAALSALSQQSSQPGSFAVFSGFDVPEDDVPAGSVPENKDVLPTAPSSPAAGVTHVSPSEEEGKSDVLSEHPVMADRSANAGDLSPAKGQSCSSAIEMKPYKADRRTSGTAVAPINTRRSSGGIFSRGSSGDVPGGRAAAAAGSKAAGAGVRSKAGQLAQGRSTMAAPATSSVSGATSC